MHHRGKTRRQVLQTALALIGAIALIVGCAAVIALLTNGSTPRHPTALAGVTAISADPDPDPATGPVTAPLSLPAVVPSVAPAAALTYTVKPGDNLTIIAAWFHLHGYGALYDANEAVIGANPSLIHPGQVITISSQGMTVG